MTQEQKIRGGDAVADWIVLVAGYDHAILSKLAGAELGPAALGDAGAASAMLHSFFDLVYAMTPDDLR